MNTTEPVREGMPPWPAGYATASGQAQAKAAPEVAQGKPFVAAIIPARGGSKGIPRKNVKPLCGKPLIAYSIEVALASCSIDQVIVSSDDDEILAIAAAYPGCLAWRRPLKLGRDNACLGHVADHVTERLCLEGRRPDTTVVLLPTSPFRNPGLVNFLVGKALMGHREVFTARIIHTPTDLYLVPRDLGFRPMNACAGNLPLFRPYGVLTAHNAAGLLPPYIHLLDDEMQMIDIDYPHQFAMAEAIIGDNLFDFGLPG
jgi:hypothetical protein